ncbi:uncharacterized protein BJ171DRAFT_594689 [Polychytrium aggregatum]|uniref:uncharacterized protein n=1 Tax=Polychytrium aggregatum TaxID=110093 RepID=UPI0022FECE12|nr:uncharacterized protein BJ171DRAFT_594689 [Polychytrium aggregatum]KAI9209658.1 hypothetical protein BJ171DRAFT_594689 [Polychytrium aggregatum]
MSFGAAGCLSMLLDAAGAINHGRCLGPALHTQAPSTTTAALPPPSLTSNPLQASHQPCPPEPSTISTPSSSGSPATTPRSPARSPKRSSRSSSSLPLPIGPSTATQRSPARSRTTDLSLCELPSTMSSTSDQPPRASTTLAKAVGTSATSKRLAPPATERQLRSAL